MKRLFSAYILLFLCISLSTLAVGCTAILPTEVGIDCCPEEWRELYEPSFGHYSLEYPSSWKRDIIVGGLHGDVDVIALIYAPSPLAFPAIRVERRVTESPSLSGAVSWTDEKVRSVKRGTRVELVDEWNTEVDGRHATTRDYLIRSQDSPVDLKKRIVSFAREDDEVALTFVTTEENFDETIPIFDTTVESFHTVRE